MADQIPEPPDWAKYKVPWESACEEAYLGVPVDKRSKGERSVTLYFPQVFFKTVDEILNATEDFGGKRENFFRFCIFATTLALAEHGTPPNPLPTSLAWIREYTRAAAEDLQRRELANASETFDMRLYEAVQAGDWQAVDGHLKFLEDWLSGHPNESGWRRAARALADRRGLANAVAWMAGLPALPVDARERAERWVEWFEGWGVNVH